MDIFRNFNSLKRTDPQHNNQIACVGGGSGHPSKGTAAGTRDPNRWDSPSDFAPQSYIGGVLNHLEEEIGMEGSGGGGAPFPTLSQSPLPSQHHPQHPDLRGQQQQQPFPWHENTPSRHGVGDGNDAYHGGNTSAARPRPLWASPAAAASAQQPCPSRQPPSNSAKSASDGVHTGVALNQHRGVDPPSPSPGNKALQAVSAMLLGRGCGSNAPPQPQPQQPIPSSSTSMLSQHSLLPHSNHTANNQSLGTDAHPFHAPHGHSHRHAQSHEDGRWPGGRPQHNPPVTPSEQIARQQALAADRQKATALKWAQFTNNSDRLPATTKALVGGSAWAPPQTDAPTSSTPHHHNQQVPSHPPPPQPLQAAQQPSTPSTLQQQMLALVQRSHEQKVAEALASAARGAKGGGGGNKRDRSGNPTTPAGSGPDAAKGDGSDGKRKTTKGTRAAGGKKQGSGSAPPSPADTAVGDAVRAGNASSTVFVFRPPNRTPLGDGSAAGGGSEGTAGGLPTPANVLCPRDSAITRVAWDPSLSSSRAGPANGSGISTSTALLSAAALPQAILRLFSAIKDDLDDPARIQAPALFVIPVIADGQLGPDDTSFQPSPDHLSSSFALCVKDSGRMLFSASRVPPRLADEQLSGAFVSFNGQYYEMDRLSTIAFFTKLLGEWEDVEVITFHASVLLMPLLAHCRGQLQTNRVTDLRTMGWVLNPTDNIADYDLVQLSVSVNQTTADANTRVGILERLAGMPTVYRKLYGQLGHRALLPAFLKQEKPIPLICSTMKYWGFPVNLDEAAEARHKAERRMECLKTKAVDIIRQSTRYFEVFPNREFNIQSTDDVREVLYGQLGLQKHLEESTAQVSTKGGKLSTAEEALRKLTPYSALPAVILAYRKVAKLFQTYFSGVLSEDRLLKLPSGGGGWSDDGANSDSNNKTLWCVHANFLQEATDTGRLSCVEPNLQNLPRVSACPQPVSVDDDPFAAPRLSNGATSRNSGRTSSGDISPPSTLSEGETAAAAVAEDAEDDGELSSAVRRCFVAFRGHTLVTIDYEQIELRVLAHLCQDPTLVDALRSADPRASDIHRRIAAAVFRKPPDAITDSERSQAKRVVFGTLYGMGARALASQANISQDRAVSIQNEFRRCFPAIDRYQHRVLEQCQREKCVRTATGRSRPMPDIDDHNPTVRAQAARQAFNTVIQGTAADIVKRAMTHVYFTVLAPLQQQQQQHQQQQTSATGSTSSMPPSATATAESPSDEIDASSQRADISGRSTAGSGAGPRSARCAPDVPVMLCQIHDELVFSVPSQMLSQVVPALRTAMTQCFALTVPLRVSVRYGPSLGSLAPWTIDGDLGLLDQHSAA